MLLFSVSFFTLAPERRRLARERRNGKQRPEASQVEAFFYSSYSRLQMRCWRSFTPIMWLLCQCPGAHSFAACLQLERQSNGVQHR
ncbi:pheST operon leader peptide PheM [Klebsiella indica]|uniref:PheST operon leader peptide PheM n=1 Tax=Klebsiella indica TaxID=2582917 RepID=A0A5R9LKN1_9ENTR|nr:pheST operon leader peptide PheM [Klebsiella indica]